MFRSRSLVLVSAFLGFAASSAHAQALTSPAGVAGAEGAATFTHFTSSSDRRFQQIDATHTGATFTVRSLGFRRDGGGGGGTATARTLNFEASMGLADMTVLSREFDPNFLPATRQTVFTRKQVNIPDWTVAAGAPAPFDFVMPLDVPYAYGGGAALVIDFTYDGVATGSTRVDRAYVGARTSNGTNLGTGCVATGQSSSFSQSMRLENNGTSAPLFGMRLRTSATRAPAMSSVVMNIDVTDQNLALPGVCSTLHAGNVASVPVGMSDATGAVPQMSFSLPHAPSLVGASLVTQLLAVDPGQSPVPVALSNGEQATMPANTATTSFDCVYHWATLANTSGTLFFGGGLAIQLGL